MPKKTRRTPPPSMRTPLPTAVWASYVVTALVSAGLGVAITLLIVHPKSTSAAPTTPASSVIPSSGTSLAPPADLTAGLPPNQAAANLGNWNYDHQNWPQAIENYQKAITGGFDNPDIRTDLGNAYRFSDQPQQALQQYQMAHKQNPSHENSLFNQGGVYADAFHDSRKAVAIWREYLDQFPHGQHVDAARELINGQTATSSTVTGKERGASDRH